MPGWHRRPADKPPEERLRNDVAALLVALCEGDSTPLSMPLHYVAAEVVRSLRQSFGMRARHVNQG